jgi:hypothetical protein
MSGSCYPVNPTRLPGLYAPAFFFARAGYKLTICVSVAPVPAADAGLGHILEDPLNHLKCIKKSGPLGARQTASAHFVH